MYIYDRYYICVSHVYLTDSGLRISGSIKERWSREALNIVSGIEELQEFQECIVVSMIFFNHDFIKSSYLLLHYNVVIFSIMHDL